MESAATLALTAVLTGDVAPAHALLTGGRATVAQALALRCELARAEPNVTKPPDVRELDALLGAAAGERAMLVRAATALGRDAVARLDGAWVRAWADRAERLAEGAGDRAAIESGALRLWARLAGSELDGLREAARALEASASRLGLAHVVIELASVAALAALAEDDLESARAIARRASRMARTEALPQSEYLAHLVLARVRRHDGRPHLATRIGRALSEVAPSPFRGWIALELALAGELRAAGELAKHAMRGPALDAADAVCRVFRACTRADRPELDAALERARTVLSSFAPLGAELTSLGFAIDPLAKMPKSGVLAQFLRGEIDTLPGALVGPASIPRAGEASGAVRVVATATSARRVLGVGLDLVGGLAEIGRESGAPQRRRETMLSVLALAGAAGLPREALFRAVWGFVFAPHLHQGVLDVALHRLRPALGDAAELMRLADGRIALRVRAPFAATDPRVERPLDDRVLAKVAGHRGVRARDLAGELDMPLRTVQAALQRLAEEGDCVHEGAGRESAYRVEDTTFREPTLPR